MTQTTPINWTDHMTSTGLRKAMAGCPYLDNRTGEYALAYATIEMSDDGVATLTVPKSTFFRSDTDPMERTEYPSMAAAKRAAEEIIWRRREARSHA